MSLVLFLQVVSQAPQHFRSSEKQATGEGCFACSVISLHSGMSRAVHPQEFSKVDVDIATFQSGLPIPLFTVFLASLHVFSLGVPCTMCPRNDLYWCLPFVFVSFKRRNRYSKALARKFHWRAANSQRFDPRYPRHSILTTWPCASSTSIAVSVLYGTKQTARTRSTSLIRRSQCWYYTVRHYNVDRNVCTIRYKTKSKDQEYVTTMHRSQCRCYTVQSKQQGPGVCH